MSIAIKTSVVAALFAGLIPGAASAQRLHRHHYAATSPYYSYGHALRHGAAPGYVYGPHGTAYLPTGPYGPNSADPYAPSAADDPYNPYAPPGAAIRAMARRNQYAPGVTNELAPDNIATASGGPSGGVPGFSSH